MAPEKNRYIIRYINDANGVLVLQSALSNRKREVDSHSEHSMRCQDLDLYGQVAIIAELAIGSHF